MTRRRSSSELVVIAWRDIPAQVNGGSGADRCQQVLSGRFQRAIDRAAVKARKKTADEYVAEWRRYTVALAEDFDGDYAAGVVAQARRLEDEFPDARIRTLVVNGGWDPEQQTEPPTGRPAGPEGP